MFLHTCISHICRYITYSLTHECQPSVLEIPIFVGLDWDLEAIINFFTGTTPGASWASGAWGREATRATLHVAGITGLIGCDT